MMVEIVSVRHHRTDIDFVQYKIKPNHVVLFRSICSKMKRPKVGLFMQDDSTHIFKFYHLVHSVFLVLHHLTTAPYVVA